MMHITMFVALVMTAWCMLVMSSQTSWLATYLKIMAEDGVQTRLNGDDITSGFKAMSEYYRLTRVAFPLAVGLFANLAFVWYSFATDIELYSTYLAFVAASAAGGCAWWASTEFWEHWKIVWTDHVAIAHTESAIDQLTWRLIEVSELLDTPDGMSDVRKSELAVHAQLIIQALIELKRHLAQLRSASVDVDLD